MFGLRLAQPVTPSYRPSAPAASDGFRDAGQNLAKAPGPARWYPGAYCTAGPHARCLLNQAFFTKVELYDDDSGVPWLAGSLAAPWDQIASGATSPLADWEPGTTGPQND